MQDLALRVAVVTGASRGLGVYVARALAAEGMKVVLAARSRPELEALRDELVAAGRSAIAAPTDVTDLGSLERLVETATAQYGAVDVLVNNAGIEHVYSYHKLEAAELDAVIDTNLRGAMQLTRLVLPGMLERHRGHIVNMSSLAGLAGPAFCEPYAAPKAVIAFTQSLRASYRRDGVVASVICPGFVDAGMYARALAEQSREAPRELGVSRPEAVGEAVVRAIREDRPEALVNPRPVGLLRAFAALAPGTAERIGERLGANDLFREQAALRERAKTVSEAT